MIVKIKWLALTAVLLMFVITLAGCEAERQPAAPTPVPAETPTPPDVIDEEEIIYGEAEVESIEIIILESFPVQVHLMARGHLPDPCWTIDEIIQEREADDTFFVTITTRRPAEAICPQVLAPFEETISLDVVGLEAGTYTVDVNGVTGTFELTVDNVLSEEPEAVVVPGRCLPAEPGWSPYFNLAGGYCLQYPAHFRVQDVLPGITGIYGPPLDESIEPLQAGLDIVVEPLGGRTLEEVVEEVARAYPELLLAQTEALLAGHPAIVVEGLPGRIANRQLFIVSHDRLYHLTLFPVDEDVISEVVPDVTELWAIVIESFTFLPPDFTRRYDACPTVNQQNSPYVNVRYAYCLVYPSHFTLHEVWEADTTLFMGTPLDDSPEPVQALLAIMVREMSEDETLSDAVDQLVDQYPDLSIERRAATLAGVEAEIVEGLPGRTGTRDLYAAFAGYLYHWNVSPVDEMFPQAAGEVDAVWNTVVDSFTFVPEALPES